MSKFLIALDDGHGMQTPGKRTPVFPPGHPYAGKFMHENEFNRAVVAGIGSLLSARGMDILFTAPTDEDTPLATRTNLANNKITNAFNRPADILVSIHANALTGQWGMQNGIETYWTKRSDEKLANIVHKHLILGTSLRDRGVKTANLHMTRDANMPACLVECGFMDNLWEAELLMSEAYREECAQEIARGICEYLGVTFVIPPPPNRPESPYIPIEIDLIDTKSNAVETVRGIAKDGVSYLEVRKAGAFFGAKVGYSSVTKKASLTK